MQSLRLLRIGARLGLCFGLVLLLLSLLGGFGIYQMSRANFYAHDLGTNWLPSIKVLGDLRAAFNEERRGSLRHLLEMTPAGKQTQQSIMDNVGQVILPKLFSAYEPMIASPEEKRLYDTFRAEWAAYQAVEKKQIELSNGGESGFPAARDLSVGDAAKAFATVTATLQKSVELNLAGGDNATAAAEASYREALTISSIVIVVAVAIGAFLAYLVTRSITAPIQTGLEVAKAVAEGDLTTRFDITGRDEPADLLKALQHMNERLVDIVSQVRHSSDSIATGSAEIAMGNSDLSQRTETQASNLEETAASMEELGSTVKTNSDTANQANRLAAEATQAAEKGGEVVGHVVSTMQEISASSRKISDIIGVIDGIAFQTNILALNAAVEAARAGEQGRGFAVVASEVRSLAQRSADAAKEIKTLIGTSVEKVENGTQLVDEAGSSMDGIVAQVKRVGALINEISSASMEQSSGINQIGDAVNQLDQVTQQNAALVEQSAAAAASLKAQSQQLADLVSVFKLSHSSGAPQPRPSRPASSSVQATPRQRPPAAPARKPALTRSPAPAALASLPKAPASGGEEAWESF